MPNKVKFNLKNVHWAVATESGYASTVNAWPGAVSLSLDPQGDDYTFYADGISYFEYHINNGYSGELESALIPEAFKTGILGDIADDNGNLVEVDDVTAVNFAFGFQVDGDANGRFYWFYNCTASRPTVSASTKEENIEVQTETLNFSNKPDPRITVTKSGKSYHPVRINSAEATTETAQTWFAEVVLPEVTP